MATSTVSDIANGRIKAPNGDAALKLHQLHIDRVTKNPPQLAS